MTVMIIIVMIVIIITPHYDLEVVAIRPVSQDTRRPI